MFLRPWTVVFFLCPALAQAAVAHPVSGVSAVLLSVALASVWFALRQLSDRLYRRKQLSDDA